MSAKCEKCGTENESDAKFCVSCGEPLVEKVRVQKKASKESESVSPIASFLRKIISFIVGFFAFTIIKVIFSLCLVVFVNQNLISVDTYEEMGLLFILISIYLAVKVVEAVNDIERLKVRIIVRIAIIIVGLISGVLLGINNSLARM